MSEYRELFPSEQEKVDAANRLAAAVWAVKKTSLYLAIPADLRQELDRALADVEAAEIPF